MVDVRSDSANIQAAFQSCCCQRVQEASVERHTACKASEGHVGQDGGDDATTLLQALGQVHVRAVERIRPLTNHTWVGLTSVVQHSQVVQIADVALVAVAVEVVTCVDQVAFVVADTTVGREVLGEVTVGQVVGSSNDGFIGSSHVVGTTTASGHAEDAVEPSRRTGFFNVQRDHQTRFDGNGQQLGQRIRLERIALGVDACRLVVGIQHAGHFQTDCTDVMDVHLQCRISVTERSGAEGLSPGIAFTQSHRADQSHQLVRQSRSSNCFHGRQHQARHVVVSSLRLLRHVVVLLLHRHGIPHQINETSRTSHQSLTLHSCLRLRTVGSNGCQIHTDVRADRQTSDALHLVLGECHAHFQAVFLGSIGQVDVGETRLTLFELMSHGESSIGGHSEHALRIVHVEVTRDHAGIGVDQHRTREGAAEVVHHSGGHLVVGSIGGHTLDFNVFAHDVFETRWERFGRAFQQQDVVGHAQVTRLGVASSHHQHRHRQVEVLVVVDGQHGQLVDRVVGVLVVLFQRLFQTSENSCAICVCCSVPRRVMIHFLMCLKRITEFAQTKQVIKRAMSTV